MKERTMKEDKEESKCLKCGIYKLGISPYEPFYKLIHFEDIKTELQTTYYHIKCLRDKLSSINQLKGIQAGTLQLLNRMGMDGGLIR